MGEIDFDRPIVDPQLAGGPGEQRHHVGRIGHPIAVGNPLAVLGDPAGRAQRRPCRPRPADWAGVSSRCGAAAWRAAATAETTRRRFDVAAWPAAAGRNRSAPCRLRRPKRAWAGPARFDAAADGGHQPQPFEKLPPRNIAATLAGSRPSHGLSPSAFRSRAAVADCARDAPNGGEPTARTPFIVRHSHRTMPQPLFGEGV